MGLFGSRKKTQVGTSVVRVMDDSTLPNSIITGSLMAIQEADGQMIEHAIEELSNGLSIRIDRLYDYAKKSYANGLPSGTTMTNLLGRSTIIQAIQAEVGRTIALQYYHVGPINLLHLGWHLLVRDHAYDSLDNSLIVNGQKVFLTDMQPVVVDATVPEMESGSLDMWGTSPAVGITPLRKYAGLTEADKERPVFVTDPNAGTDYVLVKYCYSVDYAAVVEGVNVPSTRVEQGQFSMALVGWDMGATYHQAGYSVDERKGFWLYRMESNVNPVVEAIFDEGAPTEGTFFPMTYFRYNKQAITEADPEFASANRMLDKINMKFDDLAQAINENPDITDVEQAIMMFAVPLDNKVQVEQKYLYDFFNNLWMSHEFTDADPQTLATYETMKKMGNPLAASTIIIKDKKFKMAVSWDAIMKRRVAGNVAKVGRYNSFVGKRTDAIKTISVTGIPLTLQMGQQVYRYQRQLSETVYEEIEVIGPKMTYYIWGDYTTTGDENNDDILLIPLDYAITKGYTLSEKELLYARAMHYVFNSRVVTKLKWYQTGIFKVVLIIVAIVVTIISYGSAWQSIAAAWAVGGVAAALYVIVPMLLKYVLFSLVVRKVIAAIGAKAAFVIAIIAAVAGYYQAATEGGIASAPWAKELLSVSTNLTSAMGRELKNEYNDLAIEYRNFSEYAKDKQESLDVVNSMLDGHVTLVPMIIWGEPPSDFYQRTVHSGNIGVVGIDAVSSFVDAALTLPTLSDSLGAIYV